MIMLITSFFNNLPLHWQLVFYLYAFLFLRRLATFFKVPILLIGFFALFIPNAIQIVPFIAFFELGTQCFKLLNIIYQGKKKAY